MARICDADKMQDFLEEHFGDEWEKKQFSADWVYRFIEISASENADVEEAKHGEWKRTEEPLGWQDVTCIECSACGESWVMDDDLSLDEYVEFWKYCPNCGAKMDGERKEK